MYVLQVNSNRTEREQIYKHSWKSWSLFPYLLTNWKGADTNIYGWESWSLFPVLTWLMYRCCISFEKSGSTVTELKGNRYTNITERVDVCSCTCYNVLLLHKLWVEQLYSLQLKSTKCQIVPLQSSTCKQLTKALELKCLTLTSRLC